MPTRRHILVVSGSRADYSLLYWPMRLMAESADIQLSVAVTGMHLARAFGLTVNQFTVDGFEVAARIPVLGDNDSDTEMGRAIGRGVLGFTDALNEIRPDLMLILGDRFEILAAAQAAFVQRIPIAHLCGGDLTHGALDDGFRHMITKMASVHFVTTEDAARRVRQLGEMPERIFNVGSTGIDFIKRSEVLDRAEIESQLGHLLPQVFLLVTFHPITLDHTNSVDQFRELLAALENLPRTLGIVFTYANADTDGMRINQMIDAFARKRPLTFAHSSLGPTRYLSLLHFAAAIVGNSSSGLYEAPSFNVPTINIGRRQEGRTRAKSVIDCAPKQMAIDKAIGTALTLRLRNTINPYGDGKASERILSILKAIPDWRLLVHKEFHDLSC